MFHYQVSRIQRRKRVTLVSGLYREHVGGDKFSVACSQRIGLMQVGGERKCSRQCYVAAKSSGNEKLLPSAGHRQRNI
jgi:hypothetical protein